MRVQLTGRQAQCVLCDRVFKSDAACEKHKPYATPKSRTCKDPATLGMVEGARGWATPLPEELRWYGNGPKPEPAGPQVLTCNTCGIVWERPAQRGRKPHNCQTCSAKLKEQK